MPACEWPGDGGVGCVEGVCVSSSRAISGCSGSAAGQTKGRRPDLTHPSLRPGWATAARVTAAAPAGRSVWCGAARTVRSCQPGTHSFLCHTSHHHLSRFLWHHQGKVHEPGYPHARDKKQGPAWLLRSCRATVIQACPLKIRHHHALCISAHIRIEETGRGPLAALLVARHGNTMNKNKTLPSNRFRRLDLISAGIS